jgi:hypothetical protein
MFTGGGVLAAASVAAAQTSPYTIEIHVDPPIIEPGETATIELRAGFDASREFAMAGVLTSLLCSTGSEFFSDRRLIPPMNGPGTQVGTGTTAGVEAIVAGQLQFHDIRADPTNPIPFWRATYTALGTAPVAGQAIELRTATSRYSAYVCEFCGTARSSMLEFVEGHATLTVIACRADLNQDQVLDLFDFLAFQNAFAAGEPIADFDFDGALTVFDFLAFQNRFDAGC